VEVDATAPMFKSFDLKCANGELVSVRADFEWVPFKCTVCGKFGHATDQCTNCVSSEADVGPTRGVKPNKVWIPVSKEKKSVGDHGTSSSEDWTKVKSKKGAGSPKVESRALVVHTMESLSVVLEVTDPSLVVVESPPCVPPLIHEEAELVSCGLSSSLDVPPSHVDGVGVSGQCLEDGECTRSLHSLEDEEESIHDSNPLALKAKDSLEKKKKKGSIKKNRQKHNSPKWGRWH